MNVEIAGLYWHFVDIVWIVIFTLVYLIPYEQVEPLLEPAGEGVVWLSTVLTHLSSLIRF